LVFYSSTILVHNFSEQDLYLVTRKNFALLRLIINMLVQ